MSNALATQETAMVPQTPNAMQLLQMAVNKGADIDTIERLAKLQQDMVASANAEAFNRSMHKAQSGMRRIGADATNPQTRSKYATYAKLDGVLRPVYSAEGLSVSFNTLDCPVPDSIRVVAYVSHVDGHTRTYQIDMPADGKGAKGNDVMTKTHATGAATQYGMRYLLKMIFNVAIGESDDDGNAANGKVPEYALLDWISAIEGATNRDELKEYYDKALKLAQETKDREAVTAIVKAKDKRKGELSA